MARTICVLVFLLIMTFPAAAQEDYSGIKAWSDDGSKIARVSLDTGEVVIFLFKADPISEDEMVRLHVMEDELPEDTKFAFQSGGRYLAVLVPGEFTKVYETDIDASGKPVLYSPETVWAGNVLAWGPDRFTLAVGSEDGHVHIYVYMQEGDPVYLGIETGKPITHLLLTTDALYVGHTDGMTRSYEYDGKQISEFPGWPLHWFAQAEMVLVVVEPGKPAPKPDDYPPRVAAIQVSVPLTHIAVGEGKFAVATGPIAYVNNELLYEEGVGRLELQIVDGQAVPIEPW